MDDENRILKIVNNYSRISFNFGPTLLRWMEAQSSEVYQAVLAADRESRKNFSGHGSALAQAFHHAILPLSNRRDKYTEVLWGIRDFEHRFGRSPEGMWLPETAVDLETLDILAELGIRFTILAPRQASQVRPFGDGSWSDVSGGRIDPSMAYRQVLDSGRSIDLFFYDGPVSQAVAFEGLLLRGEYLADRLLGAFSDERTWPQMVHIATDGETYGHHRRRGDMALAYALHYIECKNLARLTNYGEYLERHQPTHEVQIFENSSWSCIHGVERWRSNCGCSSGMNRTWNQNWRAPLREALDCVRDAVAPLYERAAEGLLRDPWAARDDYISVILDRTSGNLDDFFSRHAEHALSESDKSKCLKLLELERHTLLIYTSCGWFFDELSGIETVQVLQYAGRALQLFNDLFGNGLEASFLERLEQAKSNIPEHKNGREIYNKSVRSTVVDLHKVAAHYAVSSLFEEYADQSRIYCYTVDREDFRLLPEGRARLAFGRAKITSEITRESATITFGVFHLGDHILSGGIRDFEGHEAYQSLMDQVTEAFARGDFPEITHLVFQNFPSDAYTLKLLFRDEQRRILRIILDSSLSYTETVYRQLFEAQAPLMHFVRALQIPLPNRFQMTAEFIINTDLRRAFEADTLDLTEIDALMNEAKRSGIPLDEPTLEFALRRTIERIAKRLRSDPTELSLLKSFYEAVFLARSLPFEVDLWTAQNVYHEMAERPDLNLEQGGQRTAAWLTMFRNLGEGLSMRLD